MLPFIDSLHHYTTWWLGGKESICQCRILLGSTPGLGRSPAEGNGNPLQYSCLENPMDQGAWQGTVHSVTRVRHDLGTNHHHRWRNWGTGSVYNLSKVEKGWKWQLLTYVQLCDPMDCSPPGSSVDGILYLCRLGVKPTARLQSPQLLLCLIFSSSGRCFPQWWRCFQKGKILFEKDIFCKVSSVWACTPGSLHLPFFHLHSWPLSSSLSPVDFAAYLLFF